MICHIIQNGGYMFLILFLCIFVTASTIRQQSFTVQEFCTGNYFIHNIEPGEPFTLILKSEQSTTNINKAYHKYYKRTCRQEFKTTDAAAHFEISIFNMSLPSCISCRCNYFEISDLGHSKRFCGQSEEEFFASKRDSISIDFHPKLSKPFDVTFIFSVKRNSYIISATPKDVSVPVNFLETPYFPTEYPPNYRVEYIVRSDNKELHVMLLFLDFQVSHHSFIEVSGHNSTYSTRYYGNMFRPPVIVSQFNKLDLKFESNDQRGMPGFRAEIWFIKSIDSLFVPYTDCGGPEIGRDGYLNIKTRETFGLYDCMWHIMPSFMTTKFYLSVLVQLRDIGHKSNLEFRSGKYSKSDIVKIIDCETENCSYTDTEIVVVASDYLYIRFSGYLEAHSVVNMSYSTYHMGNCSNSEFKCTNGRCLLSDLRCDGIQQCPDGMDEYMCPSNEVYEDQVPVHPTIITENYHGDTMHLNFLIFVLVGTFGLVIVVIVVFIILFNRCKHVTETDHLLPQETANELSDIQSAVYSVNSSDSDDPPSYEDFIKSSDSYPPLLYTRANHVPNVKCTQCTTSFCTGARVRHYSADTYTRSSDRNNQTFLNIDDGDSPPIQPQERFRRYDIEINQNLPSKNTTMKKSCSLDSKLNDLVKKDSCNLFLSIIHPVCTHVSNSCPHVQCHTLPSNFKMNSFKTSSYNRHNLSRNFSKERRFTWSFVPPRSVGSEIVTIVKTRCFSDPCNGISVHCSLY